MIEETILEILKEKSRTSGGHCGTYAPDIMQKLNMKYDDLKPYLNSLYKQKLITIHEGAHGKLIFYKKPKTIAK